jgi:hypothetical protein
MHRRHFKYDYQAAILENQLRAITPELMAGSTPNMALAKQSLTGQMCILIDMIVMSISTHLTLSRRQEQFLISRYWSYLDYRIS